MSSLPPTDISRIFYWNFYVDAMSWEFGDLPSSERQCLWWDCSGKSHPKCNDGEDHISVSIPDSKVISTSNGKQIKHGQKLKNDKK